MIQADGGRLSIVTVFFYRDLKEKSQFKSHSHFFTFKGFIVVNGFNLGRYWPLSGPQITLYVPKEILRKKGNSIVIVELQTAPLNGEMKFSNHPIFNRN